MKYLVKDLEKILNAKKVNITNDTEITGIAIDSRKVKQGDLFIPFLGENVDGHNYIESAFEKGAAASLSLKDDFVSDNNIIYVNDSYEAIQTLAKHYLNSLNAKTIAITGSNGKTTTKDIITSVLSTKYKVHKTQGNFNNELGVPLITNIGESHIEFFKSREGIAKAKFEITNGMKKDGYFVYNGDEVLLKTLVDSSDINATSCGENSYNDIILENYTITRDKIDFKLSISDEQYFTKLKGKHNLFNIMFATAIASKIGLTNEEIRKAIENTVEITGMRLQSIPYKEDSLIINDAYNASPTSMKAGVDVISSFDDFDYKTLVLGSMFELGPNEVNYHGEVGEYISNNTNDIDLVISVGELAENITKQIKNDKIKTLHFPTTAEVSEYLKNNKHKNEVILFKASRSMKLETIIEEITK